MRNNNVVKIDSIDDLFVNNKAAADFLEDSLKESENIAKERKIKAQQEELKEKERLNKIYEADLENKSRDAVIEEIKEQKEKVSEIVNQRIEKIINGLYHKDLNPRGYSLEEVVYKIFDLNNMFAVDDRARLYSYNKEEGIYVVSSEKEIKELTSEILRNHEKLRKYASESKYASCAKTAITNLNASKKLTKFRQDMFAVNVIDGMSEKVVLHCKLTYKEKMGYVYECKKAVATNKVKFKIYAELKKENFIDHSGLEFYSTEVYYYKPSINRDAPLFKYFLTNMFADPIFEVIERRYYGAIINGKEIQTSIDRIGTGRNGKGVRSSLDQQMFNLGSHIQMAIIDFNNTDKNAYTVIDGMRFLLVNEMKQKDFNIQYFKQIIGGDSLNIRKHHENQSAIGMKTDNAGVIINANYDDIFVLPETADFALEERLTPVKTARAIAVVPEVKEFVLTGNAIINNKDFIAEYNNGEVIVIEDYNVKSDYLDWMLLGGIEQISSGEKFGSEKFGQEAIDFKARILAKMSGANETITELELKLVDDAWNAGYGCSINDLYEDFIDFSGRERGKYSKIKFTKEIAEAYKKEFGKELPGVNEDIRAYVKNYDKQGNLLIDNVGQPILTHAKIIGVAFENIKETFYKKCGKRRSEAFKLEQPIELDDGKTLFDMIKIKKSI